MERAAVLCRGDEVNTALVRSFLPLELTAAQINLNLEQALNDLERRFILEALTTSGDNKLAAAKLLGIGERTLWTKLKKHGLR